MENKTISKEEIYTIGIEFLKFLAKDHNHKYNTHEDAWNDWFEKNIGEGGFNALQIANNRIFELDNLGTIAILENKKLFEAAQKVVKAYNEKSYYAYNTLCDLEKILKGK